MRMQISKDHAVDNLDFLLLFADLALEPISVLFERLEQETFTKVWT